MWVEAVLANVAGDGRFTGADGVAVDYVDVAWDRCGRTLKARSRAGEEMRVLLPPGADLRHGDVLFDDGARRMIVNVPACPLIVAVPADARAMALLALELGNLHWPAQVGESEICFVEDGPAMAALERLAIRWSRQHRRFEPAPILSGPRATIARDVRLFRGGAAT